MRSWVGQRGPNGELTWSFTSYTEANKKAAIHWDNQTLFGAFGQREPPRVLLAYVTRISQTTWRTPRSSKYPRFRHWERTTILILRSPSPAFPAPYVAREKGESQGNRS